MKKSLHILMFAAILMTLLCCNTQNKKESRQNQGTVQEHPSGTAMGCAFIRALAALEEHSEIRCKDYIAVNFLTDDYKQKLQNPKIRQYIKKHSSGMYEYLLSRTAYFDQVVENAWKEDITQMVFLGTGYDSRPYRFNNSLKNITIYEVDTLPTLTLKKKLLTKANISIPPNVKFVSMDFTRDSFKEVLFKAGYNKNRKTLFVWEGVTMYIPGESVDKTLAFIRSNSPSGSVVCFDFTSRYHGDEYQRSRLFDIMANMMHNYSYEPSGNRINDEEIDNFMAKRGFEIKDRVLGRTDEFEKRFLTLRDGSIAGKVPVVFNIVCARVL